MNYNTFFEIIKFLFIILMTSLVVLIGVHIYKTVQEANLARVEYKKQTK